MASGGFNLSTSNGYVSGRVNWWSTPNNSGNYSDVSVEMRLSRTNTGYTTYGSGTFGVYFDGQAIENSTSFTITYNSNTLVVSGSARVYHNADGTKSFTISGDGNSNVFDVYPNSMTAYMDNIPRASTIASDISWTAGVTDLPIALNRASTSFTHYIEVQVKNPVNNSWVVVAQRYNVTDSTTIQFTKDETTKVYQQISQWENTQAWIKADTYNGGTYVGTSEKYGTVYAISTGTAGLQQWGKFDIGTNVVGWINNYNANFTYDLTLTFGSFTKSWSNIRNGSTDSSFTLTFTTAEAQTMYAQVPNASSKDGTITVRTLYNGVYAEDGAPTSHDVPITFNVTNSNPTFTTGVTYLDTNTTTTTITGNNQYIIQGYSTLQVKVAVASKAMPVNGATMVRYDAIVNGVTKSVNYSTTADVTIDFGTINASANTTLTVRAIDSRGNATPVTSTILILPYSPPTVSASATRLNNFDVSTTVTLSGNASALAIGASNKNSIVSAKYQYRQVGGTYNAQTSFTVTGFPAYSATNVTLTLDNTLAWDISIEVKDKLGTTTVVRSVAVGTPIFFIDTVKKTLGINKFPTSAANGLEIAGDLDVDGIIKSKASQTMAVGGKYGVDMRDSDIKGINALYFNDDSTGADEGFNFLKTGKTVGSTNLADYDNFCIVDSTMKWNSQNIFTQIGATSNIRLGGELNSSSNQGVYFDQYGNVKAQSTVAATNLWQVFDGDGNNRLVVPIGKSTTAPLELRGAYGGIDFYWQGFKCHQFWGDSDSRTIRFGDTGGIFKWKNSAGEFQCKTYDDGVSSWARITAIINNASSREYKKDIEKFEDNAMDIIMNSTPSLYRYNTEEDTDKLHIGLIAEDAPELITGADGKTVDSYGMAALAWKALQELNAKIENLDRRITMR